MAGAIAYFCILPRHHKSIPIFWAHLPAQSSMLTFQRSSLRAPFIVEVSMLQLRASDVGVMQHLSLKSVIGQRRRVARSNTTQSVAGSTWHNRWVRGILDDMNKPSNITHFSFSPARGHLHLKCYEPKQRLGFHCSAYRWLHLYVVELQDENVIGVQRDYGTLSPVKKQ